jgi:hypothetical protein
MAFNPRSLVAAHPLASATAHQNARRLHRASATETGATLNAPTFLAGFLG